MILAVAAAFACDVAAAVDTLKASGKRDAYDCARVSEEAKTPLVAAIIADPTNARLTRALALWLLERADHPWDPELVTRLPAADRRLLADGVRARRGRATPSPDHARVFEQMPWYQPVLSYNDGKLTPTDVQNIRLADAPPPLADSPEPAACGCSQAPLGSLAFFIFVRRFRARIRRSL